MTPAIDLTRHHFMHEVGDMVIFGTWVWSDAKEDTEPALVIMPRHRPPQSVKPCVIALSSAYKYTDMKYLVKAAKYIAECLGFEDSMNRTHRLADAIHSRLDDLIRMPPDPSDEVTVGEAVLRMPDGSNKSVLLTDNEQKPQL